MIRMKRKIFILSERGYNYLVKKIPKDHKVVLSAVCEYGGIDIKELNYLYIFTVDEDREKLIEKYKEGVNYIKTGDIDALNKLEND